MSWDGWAITFVNFILGMLDLKKILREIEEGEQNEKEALLEGNRIFDSNRDNPITKDEDERQSKAKYHCTLAKFACYIGESKGPKNVIVKNRLSEQGGGGHWYKEMKPFLKECVRSNSLSSIYSGISRLNREPDCQVKDEARNLELSTRALNGFLKVRFPIEFNEAKKTLFKPNIKSFKYGIIELTLSGVFCFRTRYKGENIVGCILISHLVKPMKTIQMQVATYLMAESVKSHLLGENEVFDPRFCICIDTTSQQYVTTPSGFEAAKIRSIISEESEDFKNRWEEKIKS